MGASVWIVVFLTMSQYMAVCYPFNYCYLRSATILAGIIGNNDDAYEKLTVIREGDDISEDINEKTSML
ncbi:hypothetical protein Tcan_06843 [Toxocara canis]|uniref:Uncharacterized protein n=1 Tax=Toxocara canis TaxID=6265 RepID=A0A0B2V812_TOXCA|nr:hypothetical protein Tcan_06843 [Toxocara canis]